MLKRLWPEWLLRQWLLRKWTRQSPTTEHPGNDLEEQGVRDHRQASPVENHCLPGDPRGDNTASSDQAHQRASPTLENAVANDPDGIVTVKGGLEHRAVVLGPEIALSAGSGDVQPQHSKKQDVIVDATKKTDFSPEDMEARETRARAGWLCTVEWRDEFEDPKRIGEIDWKLDAVNTATAREAFTSSPIIGCKLNDEELAVLKNRHLYLGQNLRALCGNRWSLDAGQLLLAHKMGIIHQLPNAVLDQIEDRSKGDFIVKTLALLNILWLFIQVSARMYHGKPITQLETMTAAFAASSLVTYILLYKKPQGVQTPYTIKAARYPKPHEILRIAIAGGWHWIGVQTSPPVPNNTIHGIHQRDALYMALGAVVGLAIFGGLHCLAWNSPFPSEAELIMWRVSSIITIAVAPGLFAMSFVVHKMGDCCGIVKAKRDTCVTWLAWIFFIVPFIVARIYTAVEALRSLAYLPPAAYQNTWTDEIPHAG